MSVFGPIQTGDLLVGKTYGAQANIPAFIASATDGDIQVLSLDSSAVAAGKKFKVFQKAAAAAGGIEYSEGIDPANVISIDAKAYTAPTSRKLYVDGFTGTVRNNVTYEVWIRLYNDGGTLSPENFRMIPGFYVTPADASGLVMNDVMTGIKDNLDATLAKESNGLFTIAINDPGAGQLSVTGGVTSFVLGKKDGRPVEFDLQAAVRDNGSGTVLPGTYYDDLSIVVSAAGSPGVGTGNQAANLEWFYSGYKYSRYRDQEYPANFSTPYYVDSVNRTYHVVTINYYKERSYTNVEKQHRTLYLLVENFDQDGGGAGTVFTAVNALISDLETATGLTIGALS